MKRDTNLFGQLIHHFKPILFLGGLACGVCSPHALLTWAEEALGCQGGLSPSPLRRMFRVGCWCRLKIALRPASASSQLGLGEHYMTLT